MHEWCFGRTNCKAGKVHWLGRTRCLKPELYDWLSQLNISQKLLLNGSKLNKVPLCLESFKSLERLQSYQFLIETSGFFVRWILVVSRFRETWRKDRELLSVSVPLWSFDRIFGSPAQDSSSVKWLSPISSALMFYAIQFYAIALLFA